MYFVICLPCLVSNLYKVYFAIDVPCVGFEIDLTGIVGIENYGPMITHFDEASPWRQEYKPSRITDVLKIIKEAGRYASRIERKP